VEGSIFVIDKDGNLREMQRSGFETEDIFQELLGKHPALLGKASGESGKLLLVTREQTVPEELGGSGRWSLDHLFIDSDAVPVLVEVKRATDTRSRREVVAQMLDYAANGIAYWPSGDLVNAFNATAAEADMDPSAVLGDFLGKNESEIEAASEAFWKQVEANLRAGRIRMLFVADKIHKELARIVEFLNEQMRPAEVLALELEHFNDGSELRTIVPRLIGATERAQSVKSVERTYLSPASEEESLDAFEKEYGSDAKTGAMRVFAWCKENGHMYEPSKTGASMAVRVLQPDGEPCWPLFVRWTTGRVEIALYNLKKVGVYAEAATRQALVEKIRRELRSAKTLNATAKAFDGSPSIAAKELVSDEVWKPFVSVIEEILKQIMEK
jgi:hypothetical protein